MNDHAVLENLLNIVSSSVGSLTNPTKLANTFRSVKQVSVNAYTIGKYLDYFIDAFIMYKALRYDIKGKRYIETPLKYYFTDVGLRNARLNFRQQEENHIGYWYQKNVPQLNILFCQSSVVNRALIALWC